MEISLLLAEDDINLGFVIADQLRDEGYRVSLATDGADALKRFSEEAYHLCIFDVMMPKKDGFALAKDIRKVNKDIPILFLTAKAMTEDKIEGFNAGGDDYLTKPFAAEELSLRIRALLKRVNLQIDQTEEKILNIGAFLLDTENLKLSINGLENGLTKKEVQILKLLFKFHNQVLPREVILNTVWGQDDYFVGRSLDVFITKLRKYLKADSRINIKNIHGIGFKMEVKE
ncbi:MAG: response regulator transcription factor [Bacteroidetes bacterium]|nr:response regulator transcription factor [Bacteroidota bacterium]MBM3424879.1 response regulator transcription factor [Bacteroidota bacterium]